MKGEDAISLPPFRLASGPMTLGAVLLRIEDRKTVRIERLQPTFNSTAAEFI